MIQSKDRPSTTARGAYAESRAMAHLTKKGYILLARNYRWKSGEADIICQAPDGAIALIEVRSSHQRSLNLRQSIMAHKVKRLQLTLLHFIRSRNLKNFGAMRIEFVWIEGEEIDHWERPF